MIDEIERIEDRFDFPLIASFGDAVYGRDQHDLVVWISSEEIVLIVSGDRIGEEWWNFTGIYEGSLVKGICCHRSDVIKIFEENEKTDSR